MEIMSDNKVVNFQPESVATFTGIYTYNKCLSNRGAVPNDL
jgi:hypothetical protein